MTDYTSSEKSRSLPSSPSLVQLKKQASNVIHAHRDEITRAGCHVSLHVWREDKEDDAAFFEKLGFTPTGLVENDTILNGNSYFIEKVTPARINKPDLSDIDQANLRTPDGNYPDHVHPLYNIHCELIDSSIEQIQQDLEKQKMSWNDYWRELALGLGNECFALVAFCDEKLAGYVRFFPSDKSHLRIPGELQVKQKDVLLIGAACVDSTGIDDRLDVELVRQVIRHAKSKGYASIQALGWSEVRSYAAWGESFPQSIYESLGFRKSPTITGSPEVLDHMLEGCHGEEDKIQVEAAMHDGQTKDSINEFHIMQLDLKKQEKATKSC